MGLVEAAAYDEVRAYDGGRRTAYTELQQGLGWDPVAPPMEVWERLGTQPLGDDHSLVPVPLALSESDHRTLQEGVAQRALALQQFYVDTFLGDQSYLAEHGGLTAGVLDEMLSAIGTSISYFRGWWAGHDPAEVRFVYGPDLIRNSAGRWMVIEDNVGCVGGCADSHFVGQAYRRAAQLPEPVSGAAMTNAVLSWLKDMRLSPEDPSVVAVMHDGDTLDEYLPARFEEDQRRARLMREAGIAVVDDHHFERACSRAVDDADSIKAVVNIGGSSATTWPLLRDVAFGQRRAAILNAPGTIVLGHKGLLPFVEDMIHHYLGEDPILGTPSTLLLQDGSLPDDVDQWVVKTATGCRGDGVFILRWLHGDQLEEVRRFVRDSWPMNAAVAQRYVEPSTIAADGGVPGSYRVEVRAPAYVTGWQHVTPSEQTVGKLVAGEPPGKLNDVFQEASYAPVVVPPVQGRGTSGR